MKEAKTSESFKNSMFKLLQIILAILLTVLLDFTLGMHKETKLIKESSRMFREEATPLSLATKALTPNVDHYYRLELRDDPYFKGDPNSPRLFRTQDDGTIMGRANQKDLPPEKKILFLGGSITECNEVDEEYRFSTLVGDILTKETTEEYQGINLGVRGHTSHDSVNLLLNHPAADQAQIVVLMNNINDRLFLANRGSYKVPINPTAPTMLQTVIWSFEKFTGDLWDYISYRSNILFLINIRLFKSNPWTGEKDLGMANDGDAIDFQDSNFEHSIQEYRRSLMVFVSVARSLNKRPVLMTQVLGRKSIPQKKFNDIVRQVASKTDTYLIDLEKEFTGKTSGLFLSDEIHLNNEGSRVVGRKIAKDFKIKLLGFERENKKSEGKNTSFNFSKCLSPPALDNKIIPGSRRLLIPPSGRYPVLSNDERFLLFQRWTGSREVIELFDKNSKLYKELSLRDDKVDDRHAIFWPDNGNNHQILFGRKENNLEKLFIRNIEKDRAEPLTNLDGLSESIPAIGKSGTIYFAGSKVNSGGKFLGAPDLYGYNRDTKNLDRLTNTSWEEWRPAPDPTGRYIYHIANPQGQFDIYRLDIDAGRSKLFYGSNSDEWDPDISRDGKWIVFASQVSGNWDIFLMPTSDPKRIIQLTSEASDDWDPKFTPLSNAILFASSSEGKPPFLYYLCPFGESQ